MRLGVEAHGPGPPVDEEVPVHRGEHQQAPGGGADGRGHRHPRAIAAEREQEHQPTASAIDAPREEVRNTASAGSGMAAVAAARPMRLRASPPARSGARRRARGARRAPFQ